MTMYQFNEINSHQDDGDITIRKKMLVTPQVKQKIICPLVLWVCGYLHA